MNTKAAAERHARQLVQLLKEPGNDQCADCGGRSPRWASWNLGIFICVQCAGVHRKLGTHITKVKSLTLDTWTREQVDRMKEVGNTRSNAKWNPDEKRNRPPANVEESERHSELERFIVKKYQGVFMERKPPPVPQKDASALRPPPSPFRARSPSPAHSATAPTPAPPSAPSAGPSIERSRTAPIPQHGNVGSSAKPTSPPPALPTRSSGLTVPGGAPPRASSSAALMNNGGHAAAAASPAQFASPSASTSTPTPSSALSTSSRSSVFDDLISLQEGPAQTAQPPLQMNPWAAMQAQAAVYPSSPLGTNGTWTGAAGMGYASAAAAAPPPPPHHAPVHAQTYDFSNLGAQAFGPNARSASVGAQSANPFFSQQQQQQQTGAYQASMMGQQAFGASGMGMSSPMHQQQAFSAGAGGAGMSSPASPQQSFSASPFFQQQQSPASPFLQQSYTQQHAPFQQQQQQQQQQQPAFGAWASSMMPGSRQ